MKYNVPIVGFIIGLLLPIIGYAIVYFIFKNNGQDLIQFTKLHWANGKNFSKLLTLSILINLIPFVYCNSKRYDYISRGVFIATMLYVVFIVLIMFVW